GAGCSCRVPGAGCACRVPGAGRSCRVPGAGCRVPGAGRSCRVPGAGCSGHSAPKHSAPGHSPPALSTQHPAPSTLTVMIRLSVNVNKIATLRNSRGGSAPSVLEAVRVCVAAGVPGITVHPRADQRHITPEDVRSVVALLRGSAPGVEYNIEGDPRPE